MPPKGSFKHPSLRGRVEPRGDGVYRASYQTQPRQVEIGPDRFTRETAEEDLQAMRAAKSVDIPIPYDDRFEKDVDVSPIHLRSNVVSGCVFVCVCVCRIIDGLAVDGRCAQHCRQPEKCCAPRQKGTNGPARRAASSTVSKQPSLVDEAAPQHSTVQAAAVARPTDSSRLGLAAVLGTRVDSEGHMHPVSFLAADIGGCQRH